MSFSHHVTQQDGIAQVLMEVLAMYALAHWTCSRRKLLFKPAS